MHWHPLVCAGISSTHHQRYGHLLSLFCLHAAARLLLLLWGGGGLFTSQKLLFPFQSLPPLQYPSILSSLNKFLCFCKWCKVHLLWCSEVCMTRCAVLLHFDALITIWRYLVAMFHFWVWEKNKTLTTDGLFIDYVAKNSHFKSDLNVVIKFSDLWRTENATILLILRHKKIKERIEGNNVEIYSHTSQLIKCEIIHSLASSQKYLLLKWPLIQFPRYTTVSMNLFNYFCNNLHYLLIMTRTLLIHEYGTRCEEGNNLGNKYLN